MSFEDIAAEKAALRKKIREARRSIPAEDRRLAALEVKRRVIELFVRRGLISGTILTYMPMKFELDILPASAALAARGARLAYPLCTEGNRLRLLVPKDEGSFTTGAYGILEPVPEASLEIDKSELDAVILPAIGFDGTFDRLGQGGGYYDRLLADISSFTVAVGFDCQFVDKVPTEGTDRPVDAVITPARTLIRE